MSQHRPPGQAVHPCHPAARRLFSLQLSLFSRVQCLIAATARRGECLSSPQSHSTPVAVALRVERRIALRGSIVGAPRDGCAVAGVCVGPALRLEGRVAGLLCRRQRTHALQAARACGRVWVAPQRLGDREAS